MSSFNPSNDSVTQLQIEVLLKLLEHVISCKHEGAGGVLPSFRLCSSDYGRVTYSVPQFKCAGCGKSYDTGGLHVFVDRRNQ